MAGLAAAVHLEVQGYRVTVLEARERLGGRIATNRVLGAPVELGAIWLHGVDGNPVAAIADHIGATRVGTDYGRAARFGVNGRALSAAAVRTVDAGYDRAVAAADRARGGSPTTWRSGPPSTTPTRTAAPARGCGNGSTTR